MPEGRCSGTGPGGFQAQPAPLERQPRRPAAPLRARPWKPGPGEKHRGGLPRAGLSRIVCGCTLVAGLTQNAS